MGRINTLEQQYTTDRYTDQNLQQSDFSVQQLSGSEFESCDMLESNFNHAKANRCKFDNCDLQNSNFSFSYLNFSDFNQSNLKHARFNFAHLEECDLSEAKNLSEIQFAGANLAYCKLPNDFEFPTLDYVQEAAKNLWVHLITIMLACLYSMIAIGSTSDKDLLHDANSIFFPLLEMSLPTVGFFYISPLIILVLALAFNFQLAVYWQRLASLPSHFPDGSLITLKTFPTLIDNMVECYFPYLQSKASSFSQNIKLYMTIAVLFAVPPITLTAYWLRYMPNHDLIGSVLHGLYLIICMLSAFITFHRIKSTTKPEIHSRIPLRRLTAIGALLLTIILCIPINAANGIKLPFEQLYMNLEFQKLEKDQQEKTARTGRRDQQQDFGFILDDQNLHHANMFSIQLSGGSLRRAHLDHSNLRKATLDNSNLEEATLSYAKMENANLNGVYAVRIKLEGAQMNQIKAIQSNFSQANFYRANLTSSDVKYSDFSRSEFKFATLDSLIALEADFSLAILNDASLNKANLRGANFYLSSIQNTHFWRADLTKANLILSDVSNSTFYESNLTEANLTQAVLNTADFQHATLSHATLSSAKLYNANLSNASITHADFSNAQLQNTLMQNADLNYSNFANAWMENTVLIGADLTQAFNLTAAQLEQSITDERTKVPPHLTYILQKRHGTDSTVDISVNEAKQGEK